MEDPYILRKRTESSDKEKKYLKSKVSYTERAGGIKPNQPTRSPKLSEAEILGENTMGILEKIIGEFSHVVKKKNKSKK